MIFPSKMIGWQTIPLSPRHSFMQFAISFLILHKNLLPAGKPDRPADAFTKYRASEQKNRRQEKGPTTP